MTEIAIEPCTLCGARRQSVCSAIPDKDLGVLACAATDITVEPGRGFIDEGDPAASFFNLTAGTARLYKLLPDGRRQITGFARTGDFLGLAVSSVYAFSAEAVDEVRLCRFSRAGIAGIIEAFPILERRLLERATNELAAAQEQMLLLGRKTARERVASFLLAQHRRLRRNDRDAKPIQLPMTRGDIADYLGLTIETVSRTFTTLRKQGIVGLPSIHEVTVLDLPALTALAGAEAL